MFEFPVNPIVTPRYRGKAPDRVVSGTLTIFMMWKRSKTSSALVRCSFIPATKEGERAQQTLHVLSRTTPFHSVLCLERSKRNGYKNEKGRPDYCTQPGLAGLPDFGSRARTLKNTQQGAEPLFSLKNPFRAGGSRKKRPHACRYQLSLARGPISL